MEELSKQCKNAVLDVPMTPYNIFSHAERTCCVEKELKASKAQIEEMISKSVALAERYEDARKLIK